MKKAFTLIELLVVIGIIGLFSGIVIVGVQGARAKARDAQRIRNLEEIQKSLELYYADYERYPAGDTEGKCMRDSDEFKTALVPWLSPMPEEPLYPDRECYVYFSDIDGSGYKIMCDLEKNPAMEADDCGVYS
ncbi:unnamed protein product, partial [marine sediment metagenome]